MDRHTFRSKCIVLGSFSYTPLQASLVEITKDFCEGLESTISLIVFVYSMVALSDEIFQFGVSDKGSIEETRDSKKNIEKLKADILTRPTALFNIQNGKVVF